MAFQPDRSVQKYTPDVRAQFQSLYPSPIRPLPPPPYVYSKTGKDKGLNLEELARLTRISKSALVSYESNEYKEINHGNLITLADFYGVSIDYLLCWTENKEQGVMKWQSF